MEPYPLQYFLIYKPYGVLSQFSEEGGHPGLGSLYDFPKHVYPVGRLDADSEGLLLLTNDKPINERLLHPEEGHPRTYWVQVEHIPQPEALKLLREGVTLRIDKDEYCTRPAKVRKLRVPPAVPERDPPIRERKTIPTAWLALTLTEGKNRQVRRMTAAVGHPTLRLIRSEIGSLTLRGLAPGGVRQLKKEAVYRDLFGE